MQIPRHAVIASVAVAFVASIAGTAQAAPSKAWTETFVPEGTWIHVWAGLDPTAHEISFEYSNGAYLITDAAGIEFYSSPSSPDEGLCNQIDADTISCSPSSFGLDRIRVATGSGPDIVDFRGVPVWFAHIRTFGGDDQVFTGNRSGDFFSVEGSQGNDSLQGGRANDRFFAGRGDDVVRTGGGSPSGVSPRYPWNQVHGDAGDDHIFGGAGQDWLTGDSGRDYVVGGKGRDQISGGPDNDTINSRDGRRDGISCGSGDRQRQHAIRDPKDELVRFHNWFEPSPKRINC